MMIILHALLITMVVSGATVFGMEDEKSEFEVAERLQCACIAEKYKYGMFEGAISEIKDYAKNNVRFTRVLNSKKATEQLLDLVGGRCLGFWRENAGIGCRDRADFYKELGAAVLGTPGAIEFGKEYINNDDQAKKRLRMFLFNIVEYGHKDDGMRRDGFIFPDEGVDIIKAGLDMFIDPQIKNDLLITAAQANKVKVVELLLDRGVDKETKLTYKTEYNDSYEKVPSYTQSYTALYAAVENGSQDAVDLLIKRGAQVNAVDAFGRTPLIMAAKYGYTEIVRKLLDAKAIVWLLDGFDKTALSYAQKGLLIKNNEQKKYEIIVQLLKDAGVRESAK